MTHLAGPQPALDVEQCPNCYGTGWVTVNEGGPEPDERVCENEAHQHLIPRLAADPRVRRDRWPAAAILRDDGASPERIPESRPAGDVTARGLFLAYIAGFATAYIVIFWAFGAMGGGEKGRRG